MLGFYLLAILCSVYVLACNGATLGQACAYTIDCTGTYQYCDTTCKCNIGYIEDGSNCYAGLGYSCASDVNCYDMRAVCPSDTLVCTCNTATHYESSGSCAAKKPYGAGCSLVGSCAGDNTECINGKCECTSGFYQNNFECVIKISFGGVCTRAGSCAGDNTECIGGMCQCAIGYSRNGGACVTNIAHGGNCSGGGTCAGDNTECRGGTCQCSSGYNWDNSACVANNIAYGESCSGGDTCAGDNTECIGGTCQCKSEFYRNNNACVDKVNVGQTCPSNVAPTLPCLDSNAACSSSTSKCECKDGLFNDNEVCKSKISLDGACPNNVSVTLPCSDPSAECTSTNGVFKCKCKYGYFVNNGACSPKIVVGGPCNISSTLPCNDSNAVCTNSNTCECTSNYYDNGGVCTSKVELGGSCSSSAACKDGNTKCSTSGECVCDTGYYDNTGTSDVGGTCELKELTGSSCPSIFESSSVPCSDTNARCTNTGTDHKCTCISGYYNNNNVCSLKESVGSSCPSILASSSLPCSDSNARCTNTNNGYKCTCIDGYYNKNNVCSLKELLGASCTYSTDCADGNAECSSQKCTCKSGYYDNTGTSDTGGTCVAKELLGAGCTFSTDCADGNAECSSQKCTCKSGYYDNTGTSNTGGICIAKKNLGSTCPNPTNTGVQSTDSCKDLNALCQLSGSTYICSCRSTYYDDNGVNVQGGSCKIKKTLGSTCPNPTNTNVRSTDSCEDSFALCQQSGSKYICRCRISYYDDTGVNDQGGSCKIKIALGAVCPNPSTGVSITEPCNDVYSSCQNDGNSYKCRCTSNYYDSDGNSNVGGQCVLKVGLGSVCPMADACIKSNSQCVSSTCVCISTYYDTNTAIVSGGDCKIRKSLNTLCDEWNSANYNIDQCSDQFATCTSGSCKCNTGYHPEGSSCVANKANGESCNATIGECSDPNSECRNNKCTCKISFYDNNGLAGGGKCELVTLLQVGSVTFSNIQTTSFTVSWSHPPGNLSHFVNYYTARWKVINAENYESSRNLSSLSTYTVTNITPGKTYRVEILSHNSQTESNDERITYVIKQQAAKPNKVQEITSSGDDLDVEKNGLTIRYIPGTGGRSGFNVRLFDGDTTIAEEDPGQGTTTSITVYNWNLTNIYGNLKNGYNYTVKIKTKSESYDNVKVVESDVFEEIMTTTPKIPQKPTLSVWDITSRNVTLDWNISGSRPGVTFFYIKVVTNDPATSVDETIEGFDKRTFKVTGLEEYWDYNISVMARTSVGSVESNMVSIQTLPAAPGSVSNFVVTKRPGGIYTQIKVTWKAPKILERNSLIKEYHLMHNTTQNNEWTTDVYRQQENMNYVYDSLLTVVPEMYYLIQVTAVNNDDEIGEVSEVLTLTPAGIPPNNVEQSHDIIYYQHDVTQTSFSVDLYKEFFQQNEHGMIRATGLIGCITDKCNFNYRMSLSEFNSMTSWTISSQNGYTTYRITKHDWLENVTRKKRQTSVNIIKFAIGVDDCVNIPDDVYCNGPLAPGSSYTIVAVACTNGGCLLSESYGPFETSKEFSCGYDLIAVIVGVVMGVIIIVLLFYSSFVTLRLRRLSKRDQTKQPDAQQQPQYVNQMFLDVVSQSPDVENIPSPEDNYTSLNEETREDKSTYETI